MSEADYVLFKLTQMQMVDEPLMRRLALRFSQLDLRKQRVLVVGVNVPSAEQVGAWVPARCLVWGCYHSGATS